MASVGVCTRPTDATLPAARAKHPLGDRARAIDPDEPIAFAPRARGIGETGFISAPSRSFWKAVADRLRRHRLQPEPFHRMLVFRQLVR